MLKILKVLTIILAITASQAAHAIDIIPANDSHSEHINTGDTHPPIKLTPDKSELIRLDKKAGSVIIGNPEHISILAENAKTLVLVPGAAGATHITILDQDSNILMRRHVIVAQPKERYIRIRKPCRGDDKTCEPTRVYFCPDMCHEINMPQGEQNTTTDNSAVSSTSSAGNMPETSDDSE
ncbi:MAG: pilus assembly protein N-terminal domain-containing protein [Alphaproteobacteria bacterium]